MSLSVNVQNLAQTIGNEMKALRTLVNGNAADLAGLDTTAKNNLVAAINEVNAAVEALATSPGGATIDDSNTSTSTVWSSSKTRSEIDAKSSIDDTTASTTTTYSSSKTESVATAKANAAASALINDTTPGTTKVYSSSKTDSQISNATAALKSDILGGAGAAYDTLKELYDLLQAGDANDQAAIQALSTAVGNRVRYDAAQSLTTDQQTQARTNIGAASASDMGDPNVNYAQVFTTAYTS